MKMERFRHVANQMTMPVPETIWLVSSGFPRTDGLLGRVYMDRFVALQSKGEGEVVVELRIRHDQCTCTLQYDPNCPVHPLRPDQPASQRT